MPTTWDQRLTFNNYAESGSLDALSTVGIVSSTASSFLHKTRTGMMTSAGDYNEVEIFSIDVTNASELTKVELTWLSQATIASDDWTVSLRLIKPDLSEDVLSSRAITTTDPSVVTVGPLNVASSFTTDGSYVLKMRVAIDVMDLSGNNQLAWDQVSFDIDDGNLAQVIKSDSSNRQRTGDGNNFQWDSDQDVASSPENAICTDQETAPHGGETTDHKRDHWTITKTGTVDSATLYLDSKCTTFDTMNSLVLNVVMIQPDSSEVNLLARTITTTDGSRVNHEITIDTSDLSADGDYTFFTHADADLGAAGQYVLFIDGLGVSFVGAASAGAGTAQTGQQGQAAVGGVLD